MALEAHSRAGGRTMSLKSGLHLKDFPLSSVDDWLNPKFAHLDTAESERLKKLGASDAALKLINRAGNFNHIDQVSALHVSRALANYKFGTSKKTLRLVGGNDQLALKMATAISDIRFDHAVQKIRQTTQGYEIRCQNGAQLLAEQVVIAIPFSVLRNTELQVDLSNTQQKAIMQLPYTKSPSL